MIGTQVTWDIVGNLPSYWPSLIAIVLFILAAQEFNMTVFQHRGGYDRATAFYCSAPGGLMESIALGEEAGCDVRLLTMQQFTRIILTLSSVPILVSFWVGEPVGSSAGLVLTGKDSGLPLWEDLLIAAAVGAIGLWIGKFPCGAFDGSIDCIRRHWIKWFGNPCPASMGCDHCAGCHRNGTRQSVWRHAAFGHQTRDWPLNTQRWVHDPAKLCDQSDPDPRHGYELSGIHDIICTRGVTEMSLIALSLSANPAVVTLHHLVRISLTVFMISALARIFGKIQKGLGSDAIRHWPFLPTPTIPPRPRPMRIVVQPRPQSPFAISQALWKTDRDRT